MHKVLEPEPATAGRFAPDALRLGGYRRVILAASVLLLGTCTVIVAIDEAGKLF